MKRMALLALALALLLLPALAANAEGAAAPRMGGPCPVPVGEGVVLLSADGRALTEVGAYQFIEDVTEGGREGELFAAYGFADGALKGRCELLGAAGEKLSGESCEFIQPVDDALLIMRDGLFGVADKSLKELIPCRYTQMVPIGDGGFLALTTDPYDERADGVYRVGADGAETATGVKIQYGLTRFGDGLMPVVSDSDGRMGYLGQDGQWAIAAQYDYAGDFLNGKAEAGVDSGLGLIDAAGNWLVTPKYQEFARSGGAGKLLIAQESNDEALVISDEDYRVIRRFDGEEIYFSASYDADCATLYLEDCTRLIDKNGETLLELGLMAGVDVWRGTEDFAVVRQGEWGEKTVWLYDLKGEKIAGPYREIWYLGDWEGKALFAYSDFDVRQEIDTDTGWSGIDEVEGTRLTGVIAGDGSVLIKPERFDGVEYLRDGFLACARAGETLVLRADGAKLCSVYANTDE